MVQTKQIYIPFSKKKLIFPFLGCLGFTVLALWIWITPSRYTDTWTIVGMIFFGLLTLLLLWMLLSKQSGITIDREGIRQDMIGLVLWQDIKDITLKKVNMGRASETYMMIILKDPQGYIEREAKSSFARKMMNSNLKSYGSPISFSATSYQMSAQKIHKLLTDKLEQYKQSDEAQNKCDKNVSQ